MHGTFGSVHAGRSPAAPTMALQQLHSRAYLCLLSVPALLGTVWLPVVPAHIRPSGSMHVDLHQCLLLFALGHTRHTVCAKCMWSSTATQAKLTGSPCMQKSSNGEATCISHTAHSTRRLLAPASQAVGHAIHQAEPNTPEHPLMRPLRAIGMLAPARGAPGGRIGHTATAAAAALLSPLQLVRAFSNVYTVTCCQLLEILEELPVVAGPTGMATARAVAADDGRGEEEPAGAVQVPAAVALLGKPANQQWAALQAHRRLRRERERVSAVQLLFAHVSDLLHFSSVMRVRPSALSVLCVCHGVQATRPAILMPLSGANSACMAESFCIPPGGS